MLNKIIIHWSSCISFYINPGTFQIKPGTFQYHLVYIYTCKFSTICFVRSLNFLMFLLLLLFNTTSVLIVFDQRLTHSSCSKLVFQFFFNFFFFFITFFKAFYILNYIIQYLVAVLLLLCICV